MKMCKTLFTLTVLAAAWTLAAATDAVRLTAGGGLTLRIYSGPERRQLAGEASVEADGGILWQLPDRLTCRIAPVPRDGSPDYRAELACAADSPFKYNRLTV